MIMDIELLYISEPYSCDNTDFNDIVKPNGKCLFDTMTMKVENGYMMGFCDIIVYPNVIAKIKWFKIFKKYEGKGFARFLYGQVEKEIVRRYHINHIMGNALPESIGFWYKMGFAKGEFESNLMAIEKKL